MNTDPEIINVNCMDGGCNIKMQLSPDLIWFKGHFPDTPVLPGVVQLDWAINMAKTYLNLGDNIKISDLEVLKFKQLILPNQQIELTLQHKSTHKFTFSYTSERGQHSSGRIVFEPVN
ncbi:thioester dehydrase [Alteromonadaceae bacterium BrNp21-10]|nr:thioester dehydrase [Alteromonadaceae bacterium BrNp21-10]